MLELWYTIFLNPMMYVLVIFSDGLWGSLGLAIIALTIIVRILIFPLTWKQLQSTKAMMALQPKMKELQKKYAKDKKKLSEEVMKAYREHKISPLGCLLPMVVQLPVWIALYQSVTKILNKEAATNPLVWAPIQERVAQGGISNSFLWMDLGNTGDFVLAILVMISMFLLQKMSTMPSADPKQEQMSRIMVLVFPLMMGFFTISLPSGLGLYFVVSNIIGIIMQYFVTGWGTLRLPVWLKRRIPIERLPAWMKRTGTANPSSIKEKGAEDGKH